MQTPVLAVFLLMFLSSAALAADVPKLAYETTCRSAQQRQGAELHTFDACMTDEQNARQELAAGLWDKAKPSTRQICHDSGSVGGSPSYIELLTCVQLYEGVVMRPADQKQP